MINPLAVFEFDPHTFPITNLMKVFFNKKLIRIFLNGKKYSSMYIQAHGIIEDIIASPLDT